MQISEGAVEEEDDWSVGSLAVRLSSIARSRSAVAICISPKCSFARITRSRCSTLADKECEHEKLERTCCAWHGKRYQTRSEKNLLGG
eukprot:747607-Hanusia_phi.AAC.7